MPDPFPSSTHPAHPELDGALDAGLDGGFHLDLRGGPTARSAPPHEAFSAEDARREPVIRAALMGSVLALVGATVLFTVVALGALPQVRAAAQEQVRAAAQAVVAATAHQVHPTRAGLQTIPSVLSLANLTAEALERGVARSTRRPLWLEHELSDRLLEADFAPHGPSALPGRARMRPTEFAMVPEPGTGLLLAGGLAALAIARRRRSHGWSP